MAFGEPSKEEIHKPQSKFLIVKHTLLFSGELQKYCHSIHFDSVSFVGFVYC